MTSMEITEDGERVEDGALHISMQLTTNIFAPLVALPAAFLQPEEVTHPPCTLRAFHSRLILSAAVGWHTAS